MEFASLVKSSLSSFQDFSISGFTSSAQKNAICNVDEFLGRCWYYMKVCHKKDECCKSKMEHTHSVMKKPKEEPTIWGERALVEGMLEEGSLG